MESHFYGLATVGEKGQIVIPSEAREALKLEKGEKLLVMSGPNRNMLMLAKPAQIEQFIQKLNAHAVKMKQLIDTDTNG